MRRIIQWGTGATGKITARAVNNTPGLDLVGTYTTTEDKDGKDVGEICGFAPIGVLATRKKSELLGMDADCVLYMTMGEIDVDLAVDEICEILASGKNVVSTAATILCYPKALGPAVVERIEAACATGNVTYHGAGVEPGWAGTTLPLIVSGAMGRIDRLHIQEILDYRRYPTTVSMDQMGFGKEPEPVPPTEIPMEHLGSYAGPLQLLADALGVSIDRVTYECDVAVADRDFEIAGGPIKKGTVAAKRYAFTAYVEGEPKIKIEHFNRAGIPGPSEWPLGRGFYITAVGDPSLKLSVDLGIHGGDDTAEGAKLAAAQVVHSIGVACDAAPGIRTVLDLPPVVGKGVMTAEGAFF